MLIVRMGKTKQKRKIRASRSRNNAARCHIVISRPFLTSLSCPGQLRSIVKSRSTMPRLTPALPLPYRYPTLPCSALPWPLLYRLSLSRWRHFQAVCPCPSPPCPALGKLPRRCPARPYFAISPWFCRLVCTGLALALFSTQICVVLKCIGLDWSGLVCGLVWSGLVWSGLVWSGLVWSGLVWSGLI